LSAIVRAFSDAVESAKAERSLIRLERIEEGARGWEGSAWLKEREDPRRFAKPEVQIAFINQQQNAVPKDHAFFLTKMEGTPAPKQLPANSHLDLSFAEPCKPSEEHLAQLARDRQQGRTQPVDGPELPRPLVVNREDEVVELGTSMRIWKNGNGAAQGSPLPIKVARGLGPQPEVKYLPPNDDLTF
jgi:hypothetical protein